MCKSNQIVCSSALPDFSATTLSWSRKLSSDINSVRRGVSIALLLAGSVGVATSATMPNSEMSYPGASLDKAFVAKEPFVLNIQDVPTTVSLGGAPRTHDFGGKAPFVNPTTGKNDPYGFQSWYSGVINWKDSLITNTGVPGRVDKTTFASDPVTLVKYNAGDGITFEKCRTKLFSFPVPPRTHVRWELEVAFGKADGVNDWTMTPAYSSPVLFWALTSPSQSNGPIGFDIDTDSQDPTKLMISIGQRVGTATAKTRIGQIHGLPKHTMIPIAIEQFNDERATVDGGKGLLQVWINNKLVLEKAGPTMALGTQTHYWSIDTYLWAEPLPYQYNRATFWKTAKMIVYPTTGAGGNAGTGTVGATAPVSAADTTAPSAPANLAATAPNATTANLSWSASTDNVAVTGYKVFRNGTQIGTSTVTNFSDTSVVGGTTYNYTVQAYDAANNLSVASNTATIKTPSASPALAISSYFVNNIHRWDATINWTTNVPSSAVVYYGMTSSLGLSKSDSTLSTSHALTLWGLNGSGTTYYYKIVAKDSNGVTYTSPVSSFKTAF